MSIKHIIATVALLLAPVIVQAQAKKPTLMIVPAPAVENEPELIHVVAKIGELMAERGFPLKDYNLQLSKGDSLMQRAGSDIVMELAWQVNRIGPKRSVTYTLRGLDSYTMKQVAASSGTGLPSMAAETPVLLQEAVLEQMDLFTGQLMDHFDDLVANGREVSVAVTTPAGGTFSLDTEIDGDPLTDIIDEWMAANTVNHRYSLTQADGRSLLFEQVRIPLYADNGMAMDSRRFATQLRRYLQGLGLKARVAAHGLGRADVEVSRE